MDQIHQKNSLTDRFGSNRVFTYDQIFCLDAQFVPTPSVVTVAIIAALLKVVTLLVQFLLTRSLRRRR